MIWYKIFFIFRFLRNAFSLLHKNFFQKIFIIQRTFYNLRINELIIKKITSNFEVVLYIIKNLKGIQLNYLKKIYVVFFWTTLRKKRPKTSEKLCRPHAKNSIKLNQIHSINFRISWSPKSTPLNINHPKIKFSKIKNYLLRERPRSWRGMKTPKTHNGPQTVRL